jgi:esterase
MIHRRGLLQSAAFGVSLAALGAPALADDTGRVNSGDTSIFFRRFGKPGKTPLLVMHGANYFDSFDWIGVCQRLAGDREVVAFDHRGFGESGWSPSKDYSIDAKMADMRALIAALGWKKPVIMGHSASGRIATSFAATHPDALEKLVIVDSGFAREEAPAGAKTIGNPPLVFPTVEAAMERFAKLAQVPRMGRDRARAEQALRKVEAGYQLKRDPDFQNATPVGGAAGKREIDVWDALARITVPILIVRGLKSDRYPPEVVTRVQTAFPKIAWATADSYHDIPFYAPDELVAAVTKFIA